MAYFKSKKKKNNLFIIYLGVFLISIAFSIKYLWCENLINDNTIIDFLLNGNVISNDSSLTDVDFLLKYALNIEIEEANTEEGLSVFSSRDEMSNPLVYIYNTHQTEKYRSTYLENYNIASSVLTGALILKEYLEDEGVGCIVEENSISDKLNSLNQKYSYSYKVSRMFLEKAKENNPTLMYFIDFHRDSASYETTTTEINGEKYARIMFVIGLDNENYAENLKFAQKLQNLIEEYDESLFRGIMKKSGVGVNGVYNQDYDKNVILIEVGGQYNYIDEVNNTLKVLAKVLSTYIKDNIYDEE